MSLDMVFLGAPGAGKGTQAKLLAESRGLAHISTGDLFRQNLKEETPLGLQAKGFMDRGLLVPDELVCGMLRSRLEEDDACEGFILDGFPRTVPQAESLDGDLRRMGRSLAAVVSFEIPESMLLERLTGRITCRSCGAMFHRRFNPPAVSGVCDVCGGGDLYTRSDDTEEAVRRRLDEYHQKTAPLVAYYRDRSILVEIDASGPIEAVQASLEKTLESS
jgi:adenylate kinase